MPSQARAAHVLMMGALMYANAVVLVPQGANRSGGQSHWGFTVHYFTCRLLRRS